MKFGKRLCEIYFFEPGRIKHLRCCSRASLTAATQVWQHLGLAEVSNLSYN
jgi:hypothetical protein